jgi:hypothetical protein
MKRYEEILNAYYYAKQLNLKRQYIMWLKPYDILEKAKYGDSKKQKSVVARGWQGWGVNKQSTEDF